MCIKTKANGSEMLSLLSLNSTTSFGDVGKLEQRAVFHDSTVNTAKPKRNGVVLPGDSEVGPWHQLGRMSSCDWLGSNQPAVCHFSQSRHGMNVLLMIA